MDAYLLKPVDIERLRTTLERWLPIQIQDHVAGPAEQMKSIRAIDRDVLAAWLGDDRDALDQLLQKFRQTAITTEREIQDASRSGELVIGHIVANCLAGSRSNCAAHLRKSRTPVNHPDFLLSKLAARADRISSARLTAVFARRASLCDDCTHYPALLSRGDTNESNRRHATFVRFVAV